MNSENPEIINSTSSEMTFFEKIKEVSRTAREDYRNTDWRGKMLLGSLALMTAYEWGPGNETLTPIVATRAIDATSGIGGSFVTAAVAGGFTYGQQVASAWLSRKTAEGYPKTAEKSYNIMNGKQTAERDYAYKNFDELPNGKKLFYAFAIGSSFSVLREVAVTGDSKNQNHLRSIGRKSAAITAGAVATLAFGADVTDQLVTIANESESENGLVDFLASSGQVAMDIIKSPVTWLSFGALVLTKDYWKTKIRKNKQTEIKNSN